MRTPTRSRLKSRSGRPTRQCTHQRSTARTGLSSMAVRRQRRGPRKQHRNAKGSRQMNATLQAADPAAAEKMLNVLVVDDDQADRKLVVRAMKQSGLRCLFVEKENVAEAVAICERQNFDFAIVDYQMPGQDGLTCIAYLHARVP